MSQSSSSSVESTPNDQFTIGDENEGKWARERYMFSIIVCDATTVTLSAITHIISHQL